jgi:hypothetical protein
MPSPTRPPQSPSCARQDEACCWICLSGAHEEGHGPLFSPCACPRKLHAECLARYQLRCLTAREREARFCRFCAQRLPDWTAAAAVGAAGGAPPAGRFAVVSIHMNGAVHKVGGREGQRGVRNGGGLPSPASVALLGRVGKPCHTRRRAAHAAAAPVQVCLPPGEAGKEAFRREVEAITGTPLSEEVRRAAPPPPRVGRSVP